MKDLCVPIPDIGEQEVAEVAITISGNKKKFKFKVESFPWEMEDELSGLKADEVEVSLARITRLKKAINNYDPRWELIQIFTPPANARYIQVLYREKNN
jgi:ferredoxin-fold anticodon binding domain-containing protein